MHAKLIEWSEVKTQDIQWHRSVRLPLVRGRLRIQIMWHMCAWHISFFSFCSLEQTNKFLRCSPLNGTNDLKAEPTILGL